MRKFATIDVLDDEEYIQVMSLLDGEGMVPEAGNSYLHKLVKTLKANKTAYGIKATLTIEYDSQFLQDAPVKSTEVSLRSNVKVIPEGDED